MTQNIDAQNWQKDLFRFISRREIQSGLENGDQLRDIINRVKKLQNSEDLNNVVDGLINSEFLIQPDVADLAREMSAKIQERHPYIQGLAVVIIGSSVHGGAKVREITQNATIHDLDWVVTYNTFQVPEEHDQDEHSRREFRENTWREIRLQAEQLIEKLAPKNNLPKELKSCDKYNAENYQLRLPRSEQDWIYIFESFLNSGDNKMIMRVVFHPSYPQEVNKNSRSVFLNALAEIHRSNPEMWSNLIDKLIADWQQFHGIEIKHLTGKNDMLTKKDLERVIRLEVASYKVMSQLMESILRTTASFH